MKQRREVRALILQALFAEEVGKNDWEQIISTIIKPPFKDNKKNYRYAERLFFETLNNLQTIDEIIQDHIDNWDINRLNTIDKLILRMAISEFLYFEEIPTKVSINEAIEISKEYSTKKSGNFINGTLDSVLEQLQEDGKVNKSGRGLINTSIN